MGDNIQSTSTLKRDEDPSRTITEPNAGSTKIRWHEWVFGITAFAIQIPFRGLYFLARRLVTRSDIPLGWDFFISTVLKSMQVLPRSITRSMLHVSEAQMQETINSNRFRPFKSDLCKRVLRPDLSGYWICSGAPGNPLPPAKCDLTILFIHGGAYIQGHPLFILTKLLRIWEHVTNKGSTTLSIFSLQWTYAPEAKFPTQINEALSAYIYLTQEQSIDPSKILIMGESSGGHLALSLLHTLHATHSPSHSKPLGTLLIYPWLDLTNSSHTYTTNAHKDIISKTGLDRAATDLLDPTGRKDFSHLLNFSSPSSTSPDLMTSYLPTKIWITVGTWDVFYAENVTFVEKAKEAGLEVKFVVEEEQPHGWTMVVDMKGEKNYLKSAPGDEAATKLRGADCLAEGVLWFLRSVER